MGHLWKLRHRKKLLENFRKFISQERHFRISSKLRHRKNLLENFSKFISQERHIRISSKLRHRKELLENVRKFISQERQKFFYSNCIINVWYFKLINRIIKLMITFGSIWMIIRLWVRLFSKNRSSIFRTYVNYVLLKYFEISAWDSDWNSLGKNVHFHPKNFQYVS